MRKKRYIEENREARVELSGLIGSGFETSIEVKKARSRKKE